MHQIRLTGEGREQGSPGCTARGEVLEQTLDHDEIESVGAAVAGQLGAVSGDGVA